jgi:hypothetical protein
MFSFINIGNVARKKFDCSNLSSSAISGSLLRRETESKSQTNIIAFKLSYMLSKEPEHPQNLHPKISKLMFLSSKLEMMPAGNSITEIYY